MHRTKALTIFVMLIFAIIVFRLFSLQVINGAKYRELAKNQRSSIIEIPARRGEILVRDTDTGNLVKLATNTTLDLVFVDPFITPNKKLVAKTLGPILYTRKYFEETCLKDYEQCPKGSITILKHNTDEEESEEESKNNTQKPNEEDIILPSFEEAKAKYIAWIYNQINQDDITFTVLKRDLPDEKLQEIEKLFLPGIGVDYKKTFVYADPTEISKKDRGKIAKVLANKLEMDKDSLEKKLTGGKVRYVKIRSRLDPDMSEKIKKIKKISKEKHLDDRQRIYAEHKQNEEQPVPDYFRGVGLNQEHLRYYPDGQLAAQIVGFVSRDGLGHYGIEGKWDKLLAGKKGIIESQNDITGMQIGMNMEKIQEAEDGASVVLTIDRVVQKEAEKIMAEAVEEFRADSGQMIIMEPNTGKIIAMVNYPTFNPNFFGNVYLRRRTEPKDLKRLFKTIPIFKKDKSDKYIEAKYEEYMDAWKEGFDPEFYVYENWLGPGAYINKTVQETYEPGSVYKAITVASALNAGEIVPSTRLNEDGPMEIGDFTIRNSDDKYRGWQTAVGGLEHSSNIVMVRIALKIGKAVFYKYITNFGFGKFTNIGLENETNGTVTFYNKWSDAQLATSAFGQGLTATPLQMANAYCALANGGVLMKAHIVSEIRKQKTCQCAKKPECESGVCQCKAQSEDCDFCETQIESTQSSGVCVKKIEPQKVKQVITPETSAMISGMLVSSVNNGVASAAKIPGYKIAGKTGTSQIARTDGVGYENTNEEGSVITSFAGYAPADNPKFVILVKFDRARVGDNTWGATTAAPTFKKMAQFLLDYNGIPPDEE